MLGFKLSTSLLSKLSTFSFFEFRSSSLTTGSLRSVFAGSGRLVGGFGGSSKGAAVDCDGVLELSGNATLLFKLIFRFPVPLTFFGGSFHPGVNPKTQNSYTFFLYSLSTNVTLHGTLSKYNQQDCNLITNSLQNQIITHLSLSKLPRSLNRLCVYVFVQVE